jgi:hypothetical protein
MTATREHLAGLELALDRWNDGGPAIQYGTLLAELIEQAQSTPEPVQGEAVAWRMWNGKTWRFCYSALHGKRGWEPLYTAALTAPHGIDQTLTNSQCACGDEYAANSYGAGFMAANNGVCENCDAYTAAAKPDAELVALLIEFREYLPFPEQRARIDAKLAELAGGENDPAPS